MNLSIILINYNSTSFTIDCIKSIKTVVSNQLSYEILVIDNNSNNDEVANLKNEFLNADFKDITLIESNRNTGFSGGNMIGARIAKGNYLAFVNNDTIFHEDSFSILFKFMQQNKNIGVSTCSSKNKDGINYACFDHFIGIRKEIFGRWLLENLFDKPKRKLQYIEPIAVDAVQGCLMFFNKSVFIQCGGFDEKLFLFYEEIDICKRVKDLGYQVVYNPNTYFVHFQGASTKKSINKKKEIMISFFYVLKKNFGVTKFYIVSVYFLFKYIFKTIFNFKNVVFLKIILSQNKFRFSMRNR
jgi:hypothetical protein